MAAGVSAGASLTGWAITGVSIMMLATRKPERNNSVYTQAQALPQDDVAFASAWNNSISAWIGNVVGLVAAFGALGYFFKVFGKLHPTKNFPYISLLVLAGFAFVFSLLFKMKHVIDGILAMRIMVQFIGQAAGVILLRKRNGTKHLSYKMPLYPLPVILVIAMWLFIFYATGFKIILSFLIVFFSGLIVYFIYAKLQKQWPYRKETDVLLSKEIENIGE